MGRATAKGDTQRPWKEMGDGPQLGGSWISSLRRMSATLTCCTWLYVVLSPVVLSSEGRDKAGLIPSVRVCGHPWG